MAGEGGPSWTRTSDPLIMSVVYELQSVIYVIVSGRLFDGRNSDDRLSMTPYKIGQLFAWF